MKSRAFTLVELLVVIAVISLLIAILAPSLKAAKDLAKATFCLTNLNALNKSVFVYTENSRGYMMVYRHDFKDGYIVAPDNTWKSYACFSNKEKTNDVTGLLKDVRGMGLVYVAGLLGPAELFYCPDQKDPRMRIDNYPRPWGSATGPGSDFIRNSYMWNPWVKLIPGSSNNWTYEDALLLSRHPNEWFLTSDLLDDYEDMSHVMGDTAKWNMGFADGHAEGWESADLYRIYTLPGGNDFSQSWLLYNAYVRELLPGSDIELN